MTGARRKGLSLIEVLIAAVIIGGPLVYIVSGMVANTRSTGRHLERATAQLLLTDMAEWIMAKPHVRPRMLARWATTELRDRWMEAQFYVDGPDRAQFGRVLDELASRMLVRVERAPEGRKGLCTVVISVALQDGTQLSVPVLLRGVPRWRHKVRGGTPS